MYYYSVLHFRAVQNKAYYSITIDLLLLAIVKLNAYWNIATHLKGTLLAKSATRPQHAKLDTQIIKLSKDESRLEKKGAQAKKSKLQ